MGELVNLRRARKRREKDDASRQANMNRAKFGRTKSDRDNEVASATRASEALDRHKLSGEDGT